MPTNSVSQKASTAQPSSTAAAVGTDNTTYKNSNIIRRPVFDDQFPSSANGLALHTEQDVQQQGPTAVADEATAALVAGDLDLAEALLDKADEHELLRQCNTEASSQLIVAHPKLLTDDASTTVLRESAQPLRALSQRRGKRRSGGFGCCGVRPAPAA